MDLTPAQATLSGNKGTAAGKYTMTVAIDETKTAAGVSTEYVGTFEKEFTITPKSISGVTVTLADETTLAPVDLSAPFDYIGSEIDILEGNILKVLDGTTELKEGTDYTLTGTTGKDAKAYKATFTGAGNYDKETKKEVDWSIAALKLDAANAAGTGKALTYAVKEAKKSEAYFDAAGTTLTIVTDAASVNVNDYVDVLYEGFKTPLEANKDFLWTGTLSGTSGADTSVRQISATANFINGTNADNIPKLSWKTASKLTNVDGTYIGATTDYFATLVAQTGAASARVVEWKYTGNDGKVVFDAKSGVTVKLLDGNEYPIPANWSGSELLTAFNGDKKRTDSMAQAGVTEITYTFDAAYDKDKSTVETVKVTVAPATATLTPTLKDKDGAVIKTGVAKAGDKVTVDGFTTDLEAGSALETAFAGEVSAGDVKYLLKKDGQIVQALENGATFTVENGIYEVVGYLTDSTLTEEKQKTS